MPESPKGRFLTLRLDRGPSLAFTPTPESEPDSDEAASFTRENLAAHIEGQVAQDAPTSPRADDTASGLHSLLNAIVHEAPQPVIIEQRLQDTFVPAKNQVEVFVDPKIIDLFAAESKMAELVAAASLANQAINGVVEKTASVEQSKGERSNSEWSKDESREPQSSDAKRIETGTADATKIFNSTVTGAPADSPSARAGSTSETVSSDSPATYQPTGMRASGRTAIGGSGRRSFEPRHSQRKFTRPSSFSTPSETAAQAPETPQETAKPASVLEESSKITAAKAKEPELGTPAADPVAAESGEYEIVVGRTQMAVWLFILVAGLAIFTTLAYLAGKGGGRKTPAAAVVSAPSASQQPDTPKAPAQNGVTEASSVNDAPVEAAPGLPIVSQPIPGQVYLQMSATEKGMAVVLAQGLRAHGVNAFAAATPQPGAFNVLIGPFADPTAYLRARTILTNLDLGAFVREYQEDPPAEARAPSKK